MKNKCFLFFILSVAPSALYASSTGWETISELRANKYGTFLVTTSGTELDPATCNGGTIPQYSLQDIETTKIIKSMALSAYMAGKKVKLSLHSAACEGGYPMINDIKIKD